MPPAADPASAPPDERLPITVLTGFLGSGKTTLLGRALIDPEFRDTAVIVNEFGAVALDHLLLTAMTGEPVVTLPNGCVCCAVRQDFAQTLYGLLRQRADGTLPPFRRLALETSGLAEPAPILYTLSADAFLEQTLRLDAVVTTVDALAGAATLDTCPEATAQAACADRLLLTKTDLAVPSADLLARLAALNPAAIVQDAAGLSPTAALFGGAAATLPRRRLVASGVHPHGIRSAVLRLRKAMSRLEFAVALGGLARAHGEDLLRVKGLVAFADRDGGPAVIHAVQHTLYPPTWLDAWPDADQTSRLVFIMRGLDPAMLLERFAAGDPELLHETEMAQGGG